MPTPELSILLPVWNGARFLDEQIESVRAQTFRDFELLIHDDGSTDGSPGIIARHAAGDPRISATRAANAGQRAALAGLAARSRAPWIAFCDQDDVWADDKLALLMARRDGAALVYGLSMLIDAEGRDLGATLFDRVGPAFAGDGTLDLMVDNTVSGHALIVARECVTASAFAPGGVFDWTVAVVASANAGVCYVPEAVTRHRQHEANQWSRFLSEERKGPRAIDHRLLELASLFGGLAEHPKAEAADVRVFAALAAHCRAMATAGRRLYYRDRTLVSLAEAAIGRLKGSAAARAAMRTRLHKAARGHLDPALWARLMRGAWRG
jgi:glycosyltransferase involved in cell wall biosynthesis